MAVPPPPGGLRPSLSPVIAARPLPGGKGSAGDPFGQKGYGGPGGKGGAGDPFGQKRGAGMPPGGGGFGFPQKGGGGAKGF